MKTGDLSSFSGEFISSSDNCGPTKYQLFNASDNTDLTGDTSNSDIRFSSNEPYNIFHNTAIVDTYRYFIRASSIVESTADLPVKFVFNECLDEDF